MKKIYYFIADWILELSSPCNQIVAHISERFDRKLSLTENLRMKTHMKFCHCCTHYKQQLDNLHEAINQKSWAIMNSDNFSERLSPEASNRIKNLLNQELN